MSRSNRAGYALQRGRSFLTEAGELTPHGHVFGLQGGICFECDYAATLPLRSRLNTHGSFAHSRLAWAAVERGEEPKSQLSPQPHEWPSVELGRLPASAGFTGRTGRG